MTGRLRRTLKLPEAHAKALSSGPETCSVNVGPSERFYEIHHILQGKVMKRGVVQCQYLSLSS
ncbi:hypothetical protein FW760_16105 [Pseudomonas sp. 1176_21]